MQFPKMFALMLLAESLVINDAKMYPLSFVHWLYLVDVYICVYVPMSNVCSQSVACWSYTCVGMEVRSCVPLSSDQWLVTQD